MVDKTLTTAKDFHSFAIERLAYTAITAMDDGDRNRACELLITHVGNFSENEVVGKCVIRADS